MTILSAIGGLIPGPIGWGLRIFAGGKSMIGKAWDWVTANIIHALIAALLVTNGGWFVVHRIDGHRIAKLQHQNEQDAALIASMNAKSEAAHAQGVTRAKENTVVHTIIQTRYRDATDRYVDSHRLPAPEGGGGTQAPANPGIPAPAPASALMASISADDLRKCSDDYAYALSAFLWANQTVADGRGEYEADPPAMTHP